MNQLYLSVRWNLRSYLLASICSGTHLISVDQCIVVFSAMYSRHSWIRAVIAKERQDREFLNNFDPSVWYSVDVSRLESPSLRSSFVQLSYDAETQEFIDGSIQQSSNVLLQLFYSLGTYLLHFFLTKTSQNGLLHRGEMFIFSQSHLDQLIGSVWQCDNNNGCSVKLLDLGAGDGGITAKFSRLTKEIFVTEMSSVMQWRLKRRGFALVDTESWQPSSNDQILQYDLISCLNLIDRHSKPLSLLASMRSALLPSPQGILVLAVVFPVSQFVEYTSDHRAEEEIVAAGKTFEQQVENFVTSTLVPAGWQVVSWTKLPYLCAGDSVRSFYVLTDAVFVLKPIVV